MNNEIEVLKDLYFERYNFEYVEKDVKKASKAQIKATKVEDELLSSATGIVSLKQLLCDECEYIRCFASCALIDLVPKTCRDNLKKICDEKGELEILADEVLKKKQNKTNSVQKIFEIHKRNKRK